MQAFKLQGILLMNFNATESKMCIPVAPGPNEALRSYALLAEFWCNIKECPHSPPRQRNPPPFAKYVSGLPEALWISAKATDQTQKLSAFC